MPLKVLSLATLLLTPQWLSAQERPGTPNVDRVFERNDANKDGFLDRAECPPQLRRRFEQLDANKDGKLSKEEMQKGMAARPDSPENGAVGNLIDLLDADKDGKLSEKELAEAAKLVTKLDANKDGLLDKDELAAALAGRKPGEYVAPAARGERKQSSLKVGDEAPAFTLPTVDGKAEVTLSAYRGQKPVVLVFASYT